MTTIVNVPDFDFSGYYYPQILEALMKYKRSNVPELTDESAYEPFIQLLRAFALVGHQNNVLIDIIANESTLPTAKLTETVRNMLRLIDYEMSPASPSMVDVVYELSKVFSASYEIINERAQAATESDASNPMVYFEALEALTIDRTDKFSYVYSCEDGVYTDRTDATNSSLPADDYSPWSTPVMNDAIYFGHKQVMWNKLLLTLTSVGANIDGVWEYYDGSYTDTAPTAVEAIGGGELQFDLTSLLGTTNRQGALVRIQYNPTAAYEDVYSTWDGSANIAVTTLLGQTSPSEDVINYSVGSPWKELTLSTDTIADFAASGYLEYTLPQSTLENWTTGTVNASSAYWLRYRIVSVSTPTPPVIRLGRMDDGKQYVLKSMVQGRSYQDIPLGSSTGLANQSFQLSREYFISESEEVAVDDVVWTRVDNFLSSVATDKHYTVLLGENDQASIVFGDGVNGKIPPLGVGNVSCSYRYGANEDGNVGSNTVTLNKSGLTFVNKLWNPRQGAGWSEAEGASTTSLEKAKIAGPASLRTRDVAIGPSDVERLAVAFTNEYGSQPFGRCKAFEEGFGPKTIEACVVAKGGGAAASDQLTGLEEYFNGDQYSIPIKEKHLVANQEVIATNYSPKSIDIVATVYGAVESTVISDWLAQVLQPEALRDDGITYQWEFGGDVPVSRLIHEIFSTSETITNVVLTTPSSDVALASRELPVAGTITITVVEP